ncbi:MAG: signal peptidase II [Anaerolineales bacterium]|nr:signal peptidase II [Anaerolineales bacterium]
MKKYLRDYIFLFGLGGVIVIIDQATKALVRANLQFSEIWSPWEWLLPYVRIVNWKNSGAAFGMLQGFGGIFSILSIVVVLVIIYYFPRVPAQDWTLRLAMGMQLGGALGNLIDRIMYDGFVTDFISLGSFPVFNVADASISVGVAVLILGMWVKEQQEKKQITNPDKDYLASASNSGEKHISDNTQISISSHDRLPGENSSDG